MNSFVVICVLFVVACNAQFDPKTEGFKKLIQDCKEETGASDKDIQGMMMHHQQEVPSKNSYCMMACMKKKTGVMTADNKIDMEKLKQEMSGMQSHHPEMYTKMIGVMEQCKTSVESQPSNLADGCTAAQALADCVKTKMVS